MSPKLLRPLAPGQFATKPKIVRLPDGTLLAFDRQLDAQRAVTARVSADHGESWGEPTPAFSLQGLPEGLGGVLEALVDQQGELHVFMLNKSYPDASGEGERGGIGSFKGRWIDIWYTRTSMNRGKWMPPRCLWEGYTGALNSVIQLKDGRLLLPFSCMTPRTWRDRGTGLDAFRFMGMFDAVVLYSDDGGETWNLSNRLRVVTPDITHSYGAVEPVVIQRLDGSVWMLIRTQMGRLYEAFSADGATWSAPQPSSLLSSDSPAGIVRLNDGRLVLCWNCCQRFPYAHGGRQVLHAAISTDDGQSWHGYREVARDPQRGEPPPPHGDHGTAYPYPVVTAGNAVLICTGQGAGRSQLLRLDPAYLTCTTQTTDFSQGLEDWSIFGTRGVALDADSQCLRIQRVSSEYPAVAVWNFPMGQAGTLCLRLQAEPGQGGLCVGLTDHFSTPYDELAPFHHIFSLDRLELQPGNWHDIEIAWDCRTRSGSVRLAGERVQRLHIHRQAAGVCYLRLAAAANEPETGVLRLARATVEISSS